MSGTRMPDAPALLEAGPARPLRCSTNDAPTTRQDEQRETVGVDDDTLRAALDELLTLERIDEAMSWSSGTAARYSRRERNGLPPADGHVGRTPVWFPSTFEAWRASRPGRGAGGGRPRREGER